MFPSKLNRHFLKNENLFLKTEFSPFTGNKKSPEKTGGLRQLWKNGKFLPGRN